MDLRDCAASARRWLFSDFFPFWAERGPHPRGGFRERLDLDGRPRDDAVGRVRVQARQTYVFARAALCGWAPDEAVALVERGVDSMLGPCRRSDGLFGYMVEIGRGLSDDRPDLYDNAFCVMALAWAARALERPRLLDELALTLERIDEALAHDAGGWRESIPQRTPRRQNPHMHMFEAALAVRDAGRHDLAEPRLEEVRALMCKHFFDAQSGRLLEYFSDDWAPVADEAVQRIEPGHEFEWAWLISQDAADDLKAIADRLYEHACACRDEYGFVGQSHRLNGALFDASKRAWPQTEALRAHVVRAETGDAEAAADAVRLYGAFQTMYLDSAPPGGWIDHFDSDDAPIVRDMTAATGYHVVGAYLELIRAAL